MSNPPRAPWLRLAWRETINNRRFSILFCLNLSIGLLGFLTLDAFKTSIQRNLEGRSKAILAADLAVSAQRPLSDDEREIVSRALPAGAETGEELNFVSMASTPTASRLVEMRAVGPNFPFYGELELTNSGNVTGTTEKAIHRATRAWVSPELLVQLGVNIGESIKIGDIDYVIDDTIKNDPSASSVSFAFAPRVFISVDSVASTGLVEKGSRVRRNILVKLPDTVDSNVLEETIKTQMQGKREIRVRSHRTASENLARLLQGLNDYLGLVALVSLFLSSVGATYLFRSFMTKRSREIAILLSVGATHAEARFVYLMQLLGLGLAAAVGTLALSAALLPFLPKVLAPFLAESVPISLGLRSIVVAILMGTGGSILFCLPLLARFSSLQPAALFQETASPKVELSASALLAWIPSLVVYWLLAIWQAQSVRVGSIFVGAFVGAGLVLAACGWALLQFGRLGRSLQRWYGRLAMINLTRDRVSAVSCFLAIGLGALLVNLIPQIRATIEGEILEPPGGKLPSLFLFDIQDEQIADLESFLKEQGIRLDNSSPLVRASLETINGNAVSEEGSSIPGTREAEREERFRSRMNNLSSRMTLSDSERLIAGTEFSGPYVWNSGEPAEMSLEMRWAERMGVGLGDLMTFDIQGVKVTGKVINLRRIRWTSFQPNFFIQFPIGVLDDAPKNFVASIPDVTEDKRANLQTLIVRRFPNVSIVDVTQSVQRMLGIIAQMATAITVMAWLSLIAGAAVLFSIANHQAQKRRKDTALLKVFGAPFPEIQRVTFVEFLALGFSASLFGGVVSLGASWAITVFVFDSDWRLIWRIPVFAGLAVTTLCVVTGWLATRQSLAAKPIDLLSSRLSSS